MCRITSVSGRSADQSRVSFGHVSPCQTHQWFCFRVFDSCVVTSRTLVPSRRFFFLRAALRFRCSKKSCTRARRSKVLHWWVEHILTHYGWCYGRGQMVFGNSGSEWLVYRCVALAMAAGSCCVESIGATDSTVKICDMCANRLAFSYSWC